jgi:hypothetical protein
MKSKKTPSKLASEIMKKSIRFTKKMDKLFHSTRKRKNKRDDLCNRNQCENPEMKQLGISQLQRKDMPQFKSIPDILAFIKRVKPLVRIKHGKMKMKISQLHPSQNEIRKSKVVDILNHWKQGDIVSAYHSLKTPIITSNTGTVIDGHHRSEALRMAWKQKLIPDARVTVYALHIPAWVAIGLANKYGYNDHPSEF